MAEKEANSLQVIGASHEHASVYASVNTGHQAWPQTTNLEHPSQNLHQAVGHDNGFSASSAHQKEPTVSKDVPEGESVATNPSAPVSGAPTSQDFSTYSHYPYSTNSYGYTNPEYQNCYYAYQQQGNDPSHQQVGAGKTTGAPYQPLSSFQNASPYVGPTSYTGTYYNPGDYQTSAGYQTTAGYQATAGYHNNCYINQSNAWNTGNTGPFPPYNYPNYTAPDTNAAQCNSGIAGAPPQYQHNYNQWAGYYGQPSSNILCPPGTERSASNIPSMGNSTSSTVGNYPYANNQPPPPGTTSWRQEFSRSGLPLTQGSNDASGYSKSDAYNAFEAGNYNHHAYQPASNIQASSNSVHCVHDNSQDKMKTFPPNATFQLSLTNQVSKSFQTPLQAVQPDVRSIGKIQIPTNPRIASNVAISVVKTDRESVQSDAASKPAYISVSAVKSNKVYVHDSSENINKGPLPPSFRAYVERTFARCKDDAERATNQTIMKEMITRATADGTIFTRDWDSEPIFALSTTAVNASEKKSPTRRTRSRWEPISEDSLAEKLQVANHFSVKNVWNNFKDNTKVVTPSLANNLNSENKVNGWHGVKFVPSQQSSQTVSTPRPSKKQRFGDSNAVDGGDSSSDSDKDQNLTKYYSSAITLANSPEERKRREHRSKRFEKTDQRHPEVRHVKTKSLGSGGLYARRTSAMQLAKNFEDNTTRAVEDIDWDSLTVKGTCQEIEKRYLRLTSAPDPASVRPEEVLEKALHMVQNSQKNYLYKCDQLKSIRQDLTVQRIHNELTVKVYEVHARFALEAGDMAEYNQCQSQLKSLYAEGIKGCNFEFSAYNLLCIILHSSNNRELLSSMSRLSAEAKEDDAVKHALAVRTAVTSGNYVLFFRLYKDAPNLNTCLMDLHVEKIRFEAVKCMCKSYRPTVPIAYVAQILGFSKAALFGGGTKDSNGLEECEDWLKGHGANVITDSSGETHLDTKASSSQLYMPEPDDAVAHGDASLAVDDFLTRAP